MDRLEDLSNVLSERLGRRKFIKRVALGLSGALAAALAIPAAVSAACAIPCNPYGSCPGSGACPGIGGCVDSNCYKCTNTCTGQIFYRCHPGCSFWCYSVSNC